MASFIEPKILKGFRDFLPPAEITRRDLLEKIEASFRSFGFLPIDTPALEYAEILLGKGGGETEKQIYRFKDNGDRDVALRFDLTVPFARFVAQYRQELNFPFKRYHIAKVWRGENTQRGRYREFTQCDFDIVGSSSPAADFEILLMIRNTLKAIGVDVAIRLNHRGLFNRFLNSLGAAEKSVEILRTVDKLAKIGRDETKRLLAEIAGEQGAEKILEYTAPAGCAGSQGSFEETLAVITALSGGESPESQRLRTLHKYMIDSGTEASFELDPSITRGLDYYTGIVYETFLNDDPAIGSVCSGGRYDNLAGLYSKPQAGADSVSGVGSSIGLDRLIAALESLGKLKPRNSYADLIIACIKEEDAGAYQTIAGQFRLAGIPCEVLLDAADSVGSSAEPDRRGSPPEGKQLTKQFMLAEKKGAPWIVIPGAEPLKDPLTLRELKTRQNREGLTVAQIVDILKKL
ncbi:histidine--tRNA ligase [Spirochaetia bacterium]|nr:histidine--tRNA ligase [Spirochaetia bacterium]